MFALHDESPIVLYSMSLSGGSKLSGLHVLITQYITSKCEIIDVIAIFKNFNSCMVTLFFLKIICKILRRNRGGILLHRELKIVYPCHFLFWVLNEIGLLTTDGCRCCGFLHFWQYAMIVVKRRLQVNTC